MDIMGLSEVSLQKKTYELAGGQKQRLAFVRAITPEFDVLFADEPTGNLDRKNAREVMNRLKTEVTGKNKSAIIVTHDVVLAEEFADQIIIIDKQNGIGQINHKNVFSKKSDDIGWVNHQGEKTNIKDLFSNILEIS
jgi:ABC-type lipoprotein export system ATPase subunit